MAWTNVDDDFLASGAHRFLSKLMEWDDEGARALGQVSLLWRNSQAQSKTFGTVEQIVLWSQLYTAIKDPILSQKWVDSLCHEAVGVLKKKSEGVFCLRGNKKHVKNRLKKIKAGKLGGERTRAKWGKNPKDSKDIIEGQNSGTCPSDATAPPGQPPSTGIAQGKARQGNSIQGNAIQINARQEDAAHVLPVGQFEIHPEFAGYPILDPTLSVLGESTQAHMLELYPDPQWLRDKLTTAILAYQAEGEMDRLGMKLVAWLGRQKDKPKRLTALNANSADPFGFDPDEKKKASAS